VQPDDSVLQSSVGENAQEVVGRGDRRPAGSSGNSQSLFSLRKRRTPLSVGGQVPVEKGAGSDLPDRKETHQQDDGVCESKKPQSVLGRGVGLTCCFSSTPSSVGTSSYSPALAKMAPVSLIAATVYCVASWNLFTCVHKRNVKRER